MSSKLLKSSGWTVEGIQLEWTAVASREEGYTAANRCPREFRISRDFAHGKQA